MSIIRKEAKCKGRFQFKDLEAHKNKSYLIVSKAIYEFFVNKVFPAEYLKTNRNIFDYCGGVRTVSGWKFMGTCMEEGAVVETPLQKVVRYYISNTGCKIVKLNTSDDRRISTVAGPWLQTEFNEYKELPWENYDVNEKFYLDMINKEIEALQKPKSKQLELF